MTFCDDVDARSARDRRLSSATVGNGFTPATRWEKFVRNMRARWRFAIIVTKGFRFDIVLCGSILLIAGAAIWAWHPSHPHPMKALHAAMALFTLQQELDFPDDTTGVPMTLGLRVLQAIWFVLPFVGITLVAEILVRLGVIVFNRVEGREEWQVAVASTLKEHVVIVGFGHNGYRVVAHIAAKDPRVVVIEQHPKDEHKEVLERYDIPLIQGDARRDDILDKAGIARARAIMALTDNDVVNLQAALRARELNPGIKVILRMFNESLGRQIERAFGFEAVLSTTSLAAPSFAAALWNSKILHTISVGDAQLHLARFEITSPSPLVGLSIADIESKHLVNILLHKTAGKSDLLPSAQAKIASGDVIYVVGELDGIQAFDDLAGTTPLGRDSARVPRGPEIAAAVRVFEQSANPGK